MFRVDRSLNRISRLKPTRFGAHGVRERDHLQEWLVNEPDALGEELLILQKEFAGFEETRERLDLLALDKKGNLVVIENKLDDSGRDLVWQALKYTAYVTPFKPDDIVRVYQQYLDKNGGGSAVERICEFLNIDEIGDADLNRVKDQRIIFIAANFRREVTTTVLWMLNRGIMVQCFKATPYEFGEELLVDIQQIIPPPEAAEYMIGLSAKQVEESVVEGEQRRSHRKRLDFWTFTLEKLREDGLLLFRAVSPSTFNWVSTGSGVGGFSYVLSFNQRSAKVELGLSRKSTDVNKWMFDQLFAERDEIEKRFGAALDWNRVDDRIQSQIRFIQAFDGFNEEAWPEMAAWMLDHIRRLEDATREPLTRLARSIP